MKTLRSVAPQALPESCIILDVRTEVEHAGSSLKRAHHHVPLGVFRAGEFLARHKIDIDKPIYTLCRSGKRATQAAEALAAAGHGNVQVIEGGIIACEAAGIPVRKGAVMSLERQVRIAAGLLVLAGTVLGVAVAPWFHAIGGVVGGGLIFAGLTDSCGLALALARAPWNKGLSRATEHAPCSATASACAVTPETTQIPLGNETEGISFYSPANGKPVTAHYYDLTKKAGTAGGCS